MLDPSHFKGLQEKVVDEDETENNQLSETDQSSQSSKNVYNINKLNLASTTLNFRKRRRAQNAGLLFHYRFRLSFLVVERVYNHARLSSSISRTWFSTFLIEIIYIFLRFAIASCDSISNLMPIYFGYWLCKSYLSLYLVTETDCGTVDRGRRG